MDCSQCTDRPPFLEPCPSCGNVDTYRLHGDTGFPQCHGCDPKICTECAYGTRYTCLYFRTRREMPPAPPKLERQINEVYWEMGEDLLRSNPALTEVKVEHFPGKYVYVVVREESGRLRRVSGTEQCAVCGDVDIRRDVYASLYDQLGHFVCEKCVSTSKCCSESSCSHSLSSSSTCGTLGSP
jgi:hypothetical protein